MGKIYPKLSTPIITKKWTHLTVSLIAIITIILPFNLLAQVPTLSYSSPQVYTAGVAITSLSPTSSGVAAVGYNSTPVIVGSGFFNPTGIGVDAAGNIYISNANSLAIDKIPAGGGAPVAIGTTDHFSSSEGVAVDAAGNVYVTALNGVTKIPAGGGSQVTIGSSLSFPTGVAVDAGGNVYVTAQNNVYRIPADGSAPVAVNSGFSQPTGIALDASGNIYVADAGFGRITKILAGASAGSIIVTGLSNPQGLAVDASGNMYVGDMGSGTIKKVPAGGGTPVTLASGFSFMGGVAVDGAGNIYVDDASTSSIKEINPVGGYFISPNLPAGLNFDQATGIISGTPAYSSPAKNYTVTAYNSTGSGTAIVNITVNGFSGLSVNHGTLSPSFNPATTSYTLALATGTTSITVTPTDTDPNSVIKVNGTTVASGAASPGIPLAAGANNVITIVATAANNATFTYTVSVVFPPTISYSSPQVFTAGVPVDPIAPTASGVATPGYGTGVSIGSGFSSPAGVAVDAAGNVYVADAGNNAIKKIPVGGGATVSIGSGFSNPQGIAVDASGNIYVADFGNNAVKKILTGTNTVVTLGTGFSSPDGVAVDAAGNVYVADFGNKVIKKIPVGGGAPVVLAPDPLGPQGVAVDATGNIYIADVNNNVQEIRVTGGPAVNSFVQGSGSVMAIDAGGNFYTAGDSKVIITPATGFSITNVAINSLNGPAGVAIDAAGNVYIAEKSGNSVKKVSPTGGYHVSPALPVGLTLDINTGAINGLPLAGSPATNYTVTAYNVAGGGTTTVNIKVNLPPLPTIGYASPQVFTAGLPASLSATTSNVSFPGFSAIPVNLGSGLNAPYGVAADAAGNIYVGDSGNNAVKKIPAGNGTPVSMGTGFNQPHGVAVDAAGNIYVADYGNNAVKKIPFGGGATVSIGSGFITPTGVAVDAAGNVYVADMGNAAVKKIPFGGGAIVSIGSGFVTPTGIAADAAGNVYVADAGVTGIIEIPAGGAPVITITQGFQANQTSVATDVAGNVYSTDVLTRSLYQITAGTTVANPVPLPLFVSPGLAIDAARNIYAVDNTSNTIKEIKPTGGYYITPAPPAGLLFDSYGGGIFGTPAVASPATTYTVNAYNFSGSATATFNLTVNMPPLPTVSYAGPQTYIQGKPISILLPTSSNVQPPAYTSTPVTLGSGFNNPQGVAVDASGNIYVADAGNNAIKKVPTGNGAPVTLGSGFSNPQGVAIDASGNIYVADMGNNAIKKIPAGNGTPVTVGPAFSSPTSVAVDATGNIFVSDASGISKIAAGSGTATNLGAGIFVAVDPAGNIFTYDALTGFPNLYQIKEFPAAGGDVILLGGAVNGPTGLAVDGGDNVFESAFGVAQEIPLGGGQVTLPVIVQVSGLAVDATGNVYLCDVTDKCVKKFNPVGGYYISPALPRGLNFDNYGGFINGTSLVSSPATNYTIKAYNIAGSTTATLNIAVTAVQTPVFIYPPSEIYNVFSAIPTLSPTGSGVANYEYSSSSVTVGSGFSGPVGVATDALGNVYVADAGNSTIKKVPVGGGSPVSIGSGFNHPSGVAVDAAGNVYVADRGNNAIKKVPAAGGTPVVLGSGFSSPTGVAVDAAGNVYVADFGNNAVKEIPTGNGTPVTVGSGFHNPTGVAVDDAGNIYVADFGNVTVKKIPVGGGAPTSLPASFSLPYGVAVDPLGNVYVADQGMTSIMEVPVGGGPPATIGSGFGQPNGVAVDPFGNVIMVDQSTNLVKKIKPIGGYFISAPLAAGLIFNNSTGTVTGTPTVFKNAVVYTVTGYNTFGSYSANTTIQVLSNSSNADLTNLTVSTGTLTPAFATATTNYTLSLNNVTDSLSVTPTAGDPSSVVTVAGFLVNSGSPSQQVPLSVGTNIITVGVISGNRMNFNAYMITAIRAAALTGLSISSGTLSPAFSTSVSAYTATVGNAISSITITPATTDSASTIKVNGVLVASGAASASIPLAVGSNTITVIVTAADGVTSRAYTIAVTRISNNANLSNLTISSGTLSPAFAGGTGSYTASVTNATTSVTVTPTKSYVSATIKVNGVTVASGTASAAIPLIVGANTIKTVVTAQDGTTTKTYTITVTRAASSNANLAGLAISSGTLSPVFATATTSYSATVSNATASLTVTPVTSDGTATIMVNGTTVNSGTASASIPLAVGLNTITTTVTAQDGTTIKTYTITVTRISTDATLAGLTISSGTLSPVFAAATTTYTASVSNATASVTVTPTAANGNATIKVNGATVASGTASASLPLIVGTNTITTIITAQDGTTIKTYTITVTRLSNNANLSALTPGSGVLRPAFSSGTTTYADTVSNATASITVTPVISESHATIKVNGVTVSSGTASASIPLSVSSNTITTVVTAQDGTTKTYTLKVVRLSNDATLSALAISSGTLSPVFAAGTLNYTDNVSNATTSVTITPTAGNANAAIKVNGVTVNSGVASAALPLVVGVNTVTIVVTAQDGTIKTYKIVVTRPSNNANLSNLTISSGTLTPAFAAGTTSYSTTVDYGISTLTITPTLASTTASVKVNGTTVSSGSASQSIALLQGTNTVTAVVTAQDHTTKTYSLTVTRLATTPTDDNLISIAISSGSLSPAFASATTGYSVSVGNAVTSITVTPTINNPAGTIKVNGTALSSGTASAPVALAVGNTTINITVTAADGVTKKTYAIVVTRVSNNAYLSNLTISSGTLSPVFTSATGNYAVTVSNATASVTVTPTLNNPHATIKVNGTTLTSGSVSQDIALAVGNTTINTVVTAQDGITKKNYVIVVTRVSNNPYLSNLAISSGTLSPAFVAATGTYTASVSNATASVTVTPTLNNPYASVKVNGTLVTSGTASAAIPLSVGANTITTLVTAQDGVTHKTYTITVTRASSGMNSFYLARNTEQTPMVTSLAENVKANNILSPNGDGTNDIWVVKNIAFYPDNIVTVFDRAGKIVFTRKGYTNDWDGTYRGSVLSEGTYHYIIDLGNGTNIIGFITVINH